MYMPTRLHVYVHILHTYEYEYRECKKQQESDRKKIKGREAKIKNR